MFCDKCGKKLAADALFCSKCGNKLQLDADLDLDNEEFVLEVYEDEDGSFYYIDSDTGEEVPCDEEGNWYIPEADQTLENWWLELFSSWTGPKGKKVTTKELKEHEQYALDNFGTVPEGLTNFIGHLEGTIELEDLYPEELETVSDNAPEKYENEVQTKEDPVYQESEESKYNLNWFFLISIIMYLFFIIIQFNVIGGWAFILIIALPIAGVQYGLYRSDTKTSTTVGPDSSGTDLVVLADFFRIINKHILVPIKRDSNSNMISFYALLGCFFLLLSPISSWFVYDLSYQYYDSYDDQYGYYSGGYDLNREGNHALTYHFYLHEISTDLSLETEWEGYYDESFWLNSYQYPIYGAGWQNSGYDSYQINYQERDTFDDIQDLVKIVKYLVWSSFILWTVTFFVYYYYMKRFWATAEVRKKVTLLHRRLSDLKLKAKDEDETNAPSLNASISAITEKIDKSKFGSLIVGKSPKKLLSGLIIATFISIFLALLAVYHFETSFISTTVDENELIITEDFLFSDQTTGYRTNSQAGYGGEYEWYFEWGRGYGIYFIHMSLLSYLGLFYNSIIFMKWDKKGEDDIEKMFYSL